MTALYDQYIPVFRLGFQSLRGLLQAASEHAEARKIDPAVLLQSRLFPDMLPLSRQVQIASDTARRAVARVAGLEAPRMDDAETTFVELQDRIDRTTVYIDSVPRDAFADAETRTITIKLGDVDYRFAARAYLDVFAIPNFHFHRATAHGILRHCGVGVGKRDYLGDILPFTAAV